MAGIQNAGFAVDKTSIRSIIQQIKSSQSAMVDLLNQFEKAVRQTEDDWENSFTASFRENTAAYIKNVRTKQEQLTKNLTEHLELTINAAENTEKTVTANASLFDS
ncbi:MAG: hypothetical protein ACI4BB_00195 [Coprococcus sp.]